MGSSSWYFSDYLVGLKKKILKALKCVGTLLCSPGSTCSPACFLSFILAEVLISSVYAISIC